MLQTRWFSFGPLEHHSRKMPKEMINVTIQRKQGEPWGMVIVGGKDQALTVKLGRIKVITITVN